MERIQSLTTDERKDLDLSEKIEGWGADLDPSKRPGVPRDKAPEIGVDQLYPRHLEQQIPRVKIHRSTEHGQMTPVFGTSCPPVGLSGLIRDFAYKYSEGRFAHWLPLLLADRINVVEDLISDISKGHIPNVWKEMGLSAELKYNRQNFLKKVTFVGVGVVSVIALLSLRKRSRGKIKSSYELA